MAVAQDLDFDVPRAADVALQKDRVVAEGRAASRLRLVAAVRRDRRRVRTTRMPRPPPPKAALMMSGKPISAATPCGLVERPSTGSSVPGTTGTPAFCARRRAAVLSPSRSSRSALGPTKVMPARVAGAGRSRILRKESVAGMDRVDALLRGPGHDALDVEVGLHRTLALADQVGFVRLEPVQAKAVFLRIDGDGAQPQFVGRAQDANGDFAAIQGKQFFHFAEENGQDVQPFFLE